MAATTDPVVTSDNTTGYSVGSLWYNSTSGRIWQCLDATTGAAVWTMVSENPSTFRNLVEGGDFTTNPFQRGTSQAADIANAVTYGPDRWCFLGGASSLINWSSVADATVAGFSTALKFQRKNTNADTAALNMAQVIPSNNSIRCQGQQVTLSFWAAKGALYSGGALTVKLESGTGANQSAATLIAGSWTNQADVISTTQTLTTTMTRYQFTGTVPATCTQLGIVFTWTPVGTAGATDFIQFQGIQLEIGSYATPFEHRTAATELLLCQRHFVRFAEPAAAVVLGNGMISATDTQTVAIHLPVTMRAAPTVTVSAGGLKFNIAGTATAVGGGFAAGATHTANVITVVGSLTATVGQATQLQGNGSTGYVQASAEL